VPGADKSPSILTEPSRSPRASVARYGGTFTRRDRVRGSPAPNAGKLWVALALLAVFHALIVFAGFFAPEDYTEQNRALPLAPPSRLHFVDSVGKFHVVPFVYRITPRPGRPREYVEDQSRAFPIRFFVRGTRHSVAGIFIWGRHLFGVESPAKIFPLGSDEYGRDQLSRLLYGGRLSLFAGLLAALLSVIAGTLLGGCAGFYGGWLDGALMRLSELFLALPWLYLLLAVRAFLPLHVSAAEALLLVVTIIGLAGWARPARLVRGVVLSARERNFVLAARGFGASDLYLLRQHMLPETFDVALTQAALLAPQYILAEVTLSFFGLGVGEPIPSWGNMLASLQNYYVLSECWWMLSPGLALVGVSLLYYALASSLQERLKIAQL
jgi:peptide/nickel transport system permease protein